MPQLALWRDLARKAAQSIRRQLAQTEAGLSSLLSPARQRQPVPIPLPQSGRRPRFPASLPGSRRFFTDVLRPSARPLHGSGRPSVLPLKTQFGRTALRPRLAGTTRVHGWHARSFSSTTINHAHVAREVHASIAQGIRAGLLNTPFFPPPRHCSAASAAARHHGDGAAAAGSAVMHGIMGSECGMVRTNFTIELFPATLEAALRGSAGKTLDGTVVREIDETISALPQFMARLRRDLSILTRAAESLQYSITKDRSMQITFYGRTRDEVEVWLRDLGIARGTLTEERPPVRACRPEHENVDWQTIFGRRRRQHGTPSDSLEDYVYAIDTQRCGSRGILV